MEFLNFLGHKEQSEWTIQGEEEGKTRSQAEEIIRELRRLIQDDKTDIIGPFPAPVARIKDIFRMNIIIKATDLTCVKPYILEMELPTRPDVIIDVEPLRLM